MTAEEKRSTAQKMLQTLELLAHSEPVGIRELSRMLQSPPSSTFRLLHDALKEGFIEKDENDKFCLSLKIVQLAQALQKNMHLPTLARPFLENLSDLTGCTSFLGMMRNSMVMYFLQVQSYASLQLNIEIGSLRPMHCTGLGKAILAFLPMDQRGSVLSQPLERKTENTITEIGSFLQELEQTRMRGYAIDREESIPGVVCIAAPVFNALGQVIAAVSLSGHKDIFTESFFAEYSGKVTAATRQISSRLGYTPVAPSS